MQMYGLLFTYRQGDVESIGVKIMIKGSLASIFTPTSISCLYSLFLQLYWRQIDALQKVLQQNGVPVPKLEV